MPQPAPPRDHPGTTAAEAAAPALVDGRYRVERELGRGGMGRVFVARDLRLGRDVALKLLAPGAHTGTQLRRFEQEARAAGALEHPNVIAVHDVGTHAGEPYIVSELIDGTTLREMLEAGPLPPERALALAVQLAGGLAAVHSKGIVHRDLKPENLLITPDGRLKILDFGIAKLVQPEHDVGESKPVASTVTGAVLGTFRYMSPEQVRGQFVDHRSDIFSFGTVLYEVLSGASPFERATPVETGYAILNDEPPALPAQVPRELERVVRRCLEKDPRNRFESAAELARELGRCSPAPGTIRRGLRRIRWRRATIAAAAVIGAAAVLLPRSRALREPRPVEHSSVPILLSGAAATGPSIAVLAFADMSPQKDQEYFSDGLAEEILNALAQVEGLHVAGRTSSFSFKGKSEDVRSIGQKLNVSTVLEGSVRKAGNRVRITAQINSVADGYHLWSQTYDRELTDIFAIQDEIARAVVSALKVKLLPGRERGTREHRIANPEAYTHYLLGKQFLNRASPDGFRRAVEEFDRSLAVDPGYAPAHAGLSEAAFYLADSTETPVALARMQRRALAAAEKAIALDPDLAEAYVARGFLRAAISWDWAGAEADLEHALALSPGDARTQAAYARPLASTGRLPGAVAALRKATDLDPLSSLTWTALGISLVFSGQYGPARSALSRALEISPEQAYAPIGLGDADLLEGRPDLALAAYGRSTQEWIRLRGAALAQHELGRTTQSQEALDALIARFAHSAAFQIAEVYAWFGERDRAMEWLERAYAQRDPGLGAIKVDPLLRKLRDDARFAALLKKMNLPLE